MLRQIENIVEDVRLNYPIIGNELDGKIYYMNGNDGTDFDWEANDRLCKFMVFHENEYGYIKIMVNRDNTIDVYVFRDGGNTPISFQKKYVGDVEEFMYYMMNKTDRYGIWDESIDELI